MMTGMILINLQKTFDTIDNGELLQKLFVIGFSKHTVDWFKYYLSKRSFLGNLGNNFPQPASVSCGVPQGSIFLIYVDDISQAVECHLFLYANDSCLVCQHEDINLIAKLLNIDFSNIRDWFADNKLGTPFWWG